MALIDLKAFEDLDDATLPLDVNDKVVVFQNGIAKKVTVSNLYAIAVASIITFDSGVPDNGDGKNTDVYIDTDDFQVYYKVADVWVSQGILQGSNGTNGTDGADGAAGAAGADGTSLEFDWNGTELGIREVGASSYTYVDLKGDTGDTGATGAAGTSISWTGAWADATNYSSASSVVSHNGSSYIAVSDHLSSSTTEPGIGVDWETAWEVLARGLESKGAWVTATDYLINNIVNNGGSSYVSKTNHTSGASTEPGVGVDWTDEWDLIASKGDTGDTGATGSTGADGVGIPVDGLAVLPVPLPGGIEGTWVALDGASSPLLSELPTISNAGWTWYKRTA